MVYQAGKVIPPFLVEEVVFGDKDIDIEGNINDNISAKSAQKTFKVATFNVLNLILPNVVYYERNKYTPEVYAKKKDWIARQLNQMGADIVGFQEVFQEEALREVLAASKMYENANIVTANPTAEKPTVALVSRFPILKQQIYPDFPSTALLEIDGIDIAVKQFSRPVLSVQLALSDKVQCTVFVVHLKSKRPIIPEGADRSDPVEQAKGQARALIQRASEACALRMILMETLKNRTHPVLVMGDFNDTGTSVTTKMISGDAPWEKMPFEQKKAAWDTLLYSVQDIQARQSYGDYFYTHIHNGYYECIDHILVSQEFVAQNPNRVGRVTYVSVLNDHLVDETLSDDEVENWQSDHGQIVASFSLNRE